MGLAGGWGGGRHQMEILRSAFQGLQEPPKEPPSDGWAEQGRPGDEKRRKCVLALEMMAEPRTPTAGQGLTPQAREERL